jgi:hypothetical protein
MLACREVGMLATPTPVANRTITDFYMEAFDDADGSRWGVFDRGGFLLHLEVGTAQRTVSRIQRHLDVLYDVGWGGLRFGPVSEYAFPRLASRPLGVRFAFALGERCGRPFTGSQLIA